MSRRFLTLCTALLLAAAAPVLHAQAVKTEHVTAELVTPRTAVSPGGTVPVGLLMQHIPQWHSYWRNPGDSGLPTTITWELPPGSRISAIDWPAPKRLPIGPLVNYGYEGELLLPLTFTAPADARPGSTLRLVARANWLVCHDVCIPESATLELQLPVIAADATPGATAHAPRFERAAAQRAHALAGWKASVQHSGRELLLTLERDGGAAPAAAPPPIEVFPYVETLIEPAVHELYATPRGYALKLRLTAGAQPPQALTGVAVAQGPGASAAWGSGSAMAEFKAPLHPVAALTMPSDAQRLDTGSQMLASAATPATARTSLWLALALAFLGGMLLNLMPCVFPVLSIKLLGLTKQAATPSALRLHAGAYAAGVIGSFLTLALTLVALQAAGQAVGWGFQLQEPAVVFVLALLFCTIGLNLMGGLEFTSLLPQRFATWRGAHPATEAFGAGVLAVVAASPCTAPFMGAALGYALTQSPPVALAVFGALGAGMAVPYVLLTLLPGWRARLPKPGPWMAHLKQGLAFPMFAAAVWLVWVLGQQAGVGAVARLLLTLVGAGALLWALRTGVAGHRLARVFAVPLLVALVAWSWPGERSPTPGESATAAGTDAPWLAYDESRLAALQAEGRPVFVDFTAAWCVSCQVNKRLVLDTAEARQAFTNANVVLMRADWTRRDAVITQALARLGRNGVPVYVLHRPGREPLLLPEVLTQRIVRDALETLHDPRS